MSIAKPHPELSGPAETGKPLVTPLRILVLGGTGFIGPCFVQAALAQGHRVSIFNRGRRHSLLAQNVERLVGDRSGDLAAISGRDWDAVIDLAAFVPAWVRSLGEALKGRVGHYTFISTVATYEVPVGAELLTEASRVRAYSGEADPYALDAPTSMHEYGALKALCEREAAAQFPARSLVLRPGHIVGPREPAAYLTYWPARIAHGGEVLVAGDPWTPIQFIDARDLAEWSIRMIENSVTGVFNATGPAAPMCLGEVVNAARVIVQPSAKIAWTPASWLAAQPDSGMWSKQLFWSSESEWEWCGRGLCNAKALANGLTFRPVEVTLADAFAAYQHEPSERQSGTQVSVRNAKGALERTAVPWPEYIEAEKRLLMRWRADQKQFGAGDAQSVTVDPDGTVHVPGFALPLSIYMSDAARRAYIGERLNSPPLCVSPDVTAFRRTLDRDFYEPRLEKAKAAYRVLIEERARAGVRTYEIAPEEGIAKHNERRVLINLHSGDFRVGAGALQLVESIPFAFTGKIKVISVDYRQGPECAFPAASEDVTAVYQDLLAEYEPENIGLYGNHTGGTLALMVLAWLQQNQLPRPGAVALISSIHAAMGGGDSYFTAPPLFPQFGFKFPAPPPSPNGRPMRGAYLANADLQAPSVSPLLFPAMLAQFPPVLLLSGTRDFPLSQVLHAHRQLVNVGVETELHVWEGMWQHFIHDVDLPESKQAYETTVRFFDRHLGRSH